MPLNIFKLFCLCNHRYSFFDYRIVQKIVPWLCQINCTRITSWCESCCNHRYHICCETWWWILFWRSAFISTEFKCSSKLMHRYNYSTKNRFSENIKYSHNVFELYLDGKLCDVLRETEEELNGKWTSCATSKGHYFNMSWTLTDVMHFLRDEGNALKLTSEIQIRIRPHN